MGLRSRDAMCGADMVYDGTRLRQLHEMAVQEDQVSPYALPTGCPVLTYHMVLLGLCCGGSRLLHDFWH